MNTYIVCPERKDKRIPIKSCLSKCADRETCKEFQAHEKPNLPEVVEGEGIPSDEKALYDKALKIRKDVEGSFWTLGQIFWRMHDLKYFYGCANWGDFCENGELIKQLGISPRTVNYLMSVVKTFSGLPVKMEECLQIGWTRLKEILPVVNQSNVKEWMKKAEELPTDKLNVEVRVATGRLEKGKSEATESLVFKIFPGQRDNILRAFELAQDITGSDARSNLLETLAIEFRTTYENAASKETALNGMLSRIEALFNVKIEATDLATGQMVRG